MKTLKSNKPWETKLSSAGLVYLHFGGALISRILETSSEDPVTGSIYDKVYENFIQEIDAIDNGIEQSDGEKRWGIDWMCHQLEHYIEMNPYFLEDKFSTVLHGPKMKGNQITSQQQLFHLALVGLICSFQIKISLHFRHVSILLIFVWITVWRLGIIQWHLHIMLMYFDDLCDPSDTMSPQVSALELDISTQGGTRPSLIQRY